jgi:hypothetical protein
VLADPLHEHAAEVVGFSSEAMGPMITGLRVATRVGALRLYNPFDADVYLLPTPTREQALAQQLSTGYARKFGVEMLAPDRIGAELLGEPGALGDLPLRVVIATGGTTDTDQLRMIDDLRALREGLDELSSRGEVMILPRAGHVTSVTDPGQAEAVAATVLEVVDEVRQRSR